MGLAKLLSLNKSTPKTDVPEEKEEQQDTESLKINNANAVYPFHDEKATSFPPPLSIDASVYTNSKTLVPTYPENQEVTESPDQNGTQIVRKDEQVWDEKVWDEKVKDEKVKDEKVKEDIPKEDKIEDDKKRYSFENEVCDLKTCGKEKCNLEACVKDRNNGTHRDSSFTKQSDLADKIGPEKLTEMINSSIKEAMQTIVKQCRMDEENGQDKKLKRYRDKSVHRTKHKYECRSRPKTLKSGLKPCHVREKHDAVRSKRLHERNIKCHEKKKNAADELKNKKRLKLPSNVRTDNRRMTGNVNIYICSEATENSQPIKPKKPEPPCTESSSETATNQSKISSSKLITCIRNKRRKFKEQSCLDLVPQKNDSCESSNTSSLISNSTDSNVTAGLRCSDFIEVCHDFDKDISDKDTESTLTECECKDSSNSDATIDRSDQSFRRSKFVVCDKIEKPCSTIYPLQSPSKSDSEEWSSKSVCSSRNDEYQREMVCDKKRGQSDFDYNNYRTSSSKEDYEAKRKFLKACRCRKQSRELTGSGTRCNCGDKRRRLTEKDNFMQPLSTCTCIAEEEEEVCGDVEECQKSKQEPITVCDNNLEGLDESAEKKSIAEKSMTEKSTEELEETKPKLDEFEYPKMKETEEMEKEGPQNPLAPQFGSQKLIRPEVLVLRNILKQQSKASTQIVDQPKSTTQNFSPTTNRNLSEELNYDPNSDHTKKEPVYMKKFNFRERYKFVKPSDIEEGIITFQEEEDEVPEVKENEENTSGRRTSFQEKARNSFLYKRFKKVLEKNSPERKSEKSNKEDKSAEDTKEHSTNKKTKAAKTRGGADQPTPDSKSTKDKDKLISKVNVYKMMKTKKSKPKSNAAAPKSATEKDDENEAEPEPAEATEVETEKEESKEEIPDDAANMQERSKLLASMINKVASPPPIKDARKESLEQTKSEKLLRSSEEIPKKIETLGPPRDTEIRRNLYDQERKEPEIQKPVTEDKPSRIETNLEAPAQRVPCVRKLTNSKQFTDLQCSQIHPPESHTTCVSQKFMKCTDINQTLPVDSERFDESRCNCCCLPISQCTDEFMNYPKSCLKKERQFRCINSQEMNSSILCHEKRNWGECGCRRILLCEGCRRPRTECSCRCTYVSCTNCCKPRSKCDCKSICQSRKSMICVYCDSPREKCRCRAPVRKCSCCGLSVDMCRCEDQATICEGRPVLTEQDNDRTMYVTAWKPREEIRRYFSRSLDVPRTDSINECWCCEKLKHHNSDDLPYQRLSVFSDVMDELQQKISESTCCTRCRKAPCCCNIEGEGGTDERKIKYCISPKTRRKLVAVCMEKPKIKSSSNYKCDTGKEKSDKQRKIIVSLCCLCKSAPCRCKRSKSSQKKPRAKCYYCKSSPCMCIATGDCNKPRPCRCNDSPCRTKEKDNASRGKISGKSRNNDEKIICVR